MLNLKIALRGMCDRVVSARHAALAAYSLLAAHFAYGAETQTIGTVADNLTENVSSLQSLIINGMYLVGAALVALAFFWFYKSGKEDGRGHIKNGLMALSAGFAMLLAPVVLQLIAGSAGVDPENLNQSFNAATSD